MDIKKFAYVLSSNVELSNISNIDFNDINQNKIYIDFKEDKISDRVYYQLKVNIIYFEVDENKIINGKVLHCDTNIDSGNYNRLTLRIYYKFNNDLIDTLCKKLYESNNKKEV